MTAYRYKCVAAPRRAKKTREHKTPADALAAAFEAAIAVEVAQGWEYLRTDLAPMEARSGLFGRVEESHQGVMVFRRPAGAAIAQDWPQHDRMRRDSAESEAAPRRASLDDAPEIPRLGAARID